LGPLKQRAGVDVSHTPSDLLRTANFQALPGFDCMDKLRRVKEALKRSGIQPRYSAMQLLDPQFPSLQIDPINVADLKFAPGRGL